MLKKHFSRFISILFIVLVSVGFTSGLGASSDKIKSSINDGRMRGKNGIFQTFSRRTYQNKK